MKLNDQKKRRFTDRLRDFLTTDSQRSLFDELDNVSVPPVYNMGGRGQYGLLSSIPDMLEDPIISSALSLIMETSFQIGDRNSVFSVRSDYSVLQSELEKFHEEHNFNQLLLDTAYNLLLWGNLPFEITYDDYSRVIGVKVIPDFTKVTPIIVSGILVGYLVDGEYRYPFEFVYGQLSHYKNLGGIGSTLTTLSTGDGSVENEFVLAPSYLSSAAKAWRNVSIIEDALLLHRMDQSNYYRIISVDVGQSVYSKPAIKILSYYRNLFRKVRRVDYNASGMASRGSGQEFEIVIPKAQGSNGVDVTDIGGNIDVKALKDLDNEYKRLFAALRIQPSMIGFSEEAPSSLGDSPAQLWEMRFGKTCKSLVYSALKVVRDIDTLYLRSRGYDVRPDDWRYVTVSTSSMEDAQRAKTLKESADALESILSKLNDGDIEYNKTYLFETVLGSAFESVGIDVRKVFGDGSNMDKDASMVVASASLFKSKPLTDVQATVLKSAGLLDLDVEASAPTARGLVASSVCTFDQLARDVSLYRDDYVVDVSSQVFSSALTSDDVMSITESRDAVAERYARVQSGLPVSVPADVDVSNITAGELMSASYTPIRVAVQGSSSLVLTSREDVVSYLSYAVNGMDGCVVENLYSRGVRK